MATTSSEDQETVLTTGRSEPPPPATSPPASGAGGAREAAGGSRIGKYEIVRLLGRGGMGAVYEAFDPMLERAVALKVMLPEVAGDPEHKQRFEREARAVARLSHPGVVTVFDLGYHTDGSPYIVMELLRGQDLLTRVRQGPPLGFQDKLSIVVQVLDGLGHAHRAGIVHRDIKPANVFLSEEGAAKIMDFGIAFWTASGGTSRTVLGTVGYMSPEQVQGHRVDGRSDLFSVGTLLCEMLTGRRPFDGGTPMATFYRIARGQATIELPTGPEYQAILPVLRRALAVAVEERYPTAAEFAAALRASVGVEAGREATATADVKAVPHAERRAPAAAEAPVPRADPGPVFRLLREVYVGSKSGHLHIGVSGERKSLRILKGQIVHGTSDAAGEHMGDVLVRYGLLGQADLDRAVAIVLRERKRLGVVLQQLGLLERSRIEEAVGLHAREILFNAIARPGVTCGFEELADSLLETDIVCPISTGQLILEATRRILDPDLVRTVLGDLGRVLVLSPDPLLRNQRITLTPADGFLLSRIDGVSSARDILSLVPLPAEDAERSLFSLLCTGIVDYRRDAPSAPAITPRPTMRRAPAPPRAAQPFATSPGQPAAPITPPAATHPRGERVTAPPATEPARPADRVEEIRSVILETFGRIRRDHFEVMGLERGATEAEVREAYVRLARTLHPDVGHDSVLTDLLEKREAAFIRVNEAYEILRDPASRAKYERDLAPARPRAPRAVPPATASEARDIPTPARAKAPPAAANAPPAPAKAPPAPAKAPPAQAPRAPSTTAPPPAPEVDERLQPEHILAVAEQMFEKAAYWEAIQQLEPMVSRAQGPTRVHARMLLARAYMRNPKWTKRAERVLQSVVEENPRDVEALLALAGLYRQAHLPARATSLYRKVLEVRPGCSEAIHALAALSPQDEPAPASSRLASLFKKH